MITRLSNSALGEMGGRMRAAYLMEQAGYTQGVAALDGEALESLLPDGFLREVAEAMDRIQAALQENILLADEAKEAKVETARAEAEKAKAEIFAARAGRTGKADPQAATQPHPGGHP